MLITGSIVFFTYLEAYHQDEGSYKLGQKFTDKRIRR